MCKRRIACRSSNSLTEYEEESSKGERRVARKGSPFISCVLCVSIGLLIPRWTSAEDKDPCLPHCWKSQSAKNVRFNDGIFLKQIDTENECKDLCVNNETCIGVYWGINPILKLKSCWFQMPYTGVSESLTNATHWTLADCTDNCLPYCWKEKWTHIQVMGGLLQNSVDSENDCKLVCANDKQCNGADWNNTEKSCWLLFMPIITHVTAPDPIHHWEIKRELSTTCIHGSTALVPKIMTSVHAIAGTAGTTIVGNASAGIIVIDVSGKTMLVENPSALTSEFGESVTLGYEASINGSTENVSNFISFEPSNETNITEEADIYVNNIPSRGRPKSGPIVGYSHGKGSPHHYNAAHCHCPDYMLGIIVMAATMAVLVLIIIGLIAFIVKRLREEPEEDESKGQPGSLYGYRSYHTIRDSLGEFLASATPSTSSVSTSSKLKVPSI